MCNFLEMNFILCITTIYYLINYGVNCRAIDDDDDNDISNAIHPENPFTTNRNWIKLSESPPSVIVQQYGTTLELECEMTGSPPPKIQWVQGNKPDFNNGNDIDTNLISENYSKSIGRVRSRLLIDRILLHEKKFTCVGQSGSKTVYATTTVKSPGHLLKSRNITELFALNSNVMNGPKKSRIILYYSMIFEIIGENVILPCKSIGRPYPEVYWLDTDDNIIDDKEPRYKVLSTGELLISHLRWSDMGSYTCVARNAFGKDTISTFIYPVLNDA